MVRSAVLEVAETRQWPILIFALFVELEVSLEVRYIATKAVL